VRRRAQSDAPMISPSQLCVQLVAVTRAGLVRPSSIVHHPWCRRATRAPLSFGRVILCIPLIYLEAGPLSAQMQRGLHRMLPVGPWPLEDALQLKNQIPVCTNTTAVATREQVLRTRSTPAPGPRGPNEAHQLHGDGAMTDDAESQPVVVSAPTDVSRCHRSAPGAESQRYTSS
jgi:hypothetical protein